MYNFKNSSLTIIMYHYVRKVKNSLYPKLKAFEISDFKKQIKFLKENYNILKSDQILQILKDKKIPKKPSVLLTFDDGYSDHYEVSEFLSKHHLEGFFYVVGSAVKREKIMDVNKIQFIMEKEQNSYKLIKMVLEKYKKIKGQEINLRSIEKNAVKEHKYNLFDNFENFFLKGLLRIWIEKETRQKILNGLFKEIIDEDEKSFANKLYLKKKQMVEMKKNNMNFGVHGYEHFPLGYLKEDEQKKQFEKSINFLKFLNQDIKETSVCYPNGSYNHNTLKLMKKYQFAFGLTINNGCIQKKNIKNNFELPRIDVTKISF